MSVRARSRKNALPARAPAPQRVASQGVTSLAQEAQRKVPALHPIIHSRRVEEHAAGVASISAEVRVALL